MISDFIWMDGELIPHDDAKIHIHSPTLHYGPGVFEGIRCYATDKGPAIFRLREHMARFLNSIHVLGLEAPYSVDELCEAAKATVLANNFDACYVRPLMYLAGPLGLNLYTATLHFSISTWEWGTYLGEEALENGASAHVSSFTRMHPNAGMTKAKINGQYVNSMLAKSFALKAGFDEAIMLDPEGYVAECTGENIFLVREGVIYTPPKAAILEGITRSSLLTLIDDLGYSLVEETISRDQLYICDEIFVCGTAAEVTPISSVDFRKIGAGKRGPVTQAVQKAFFDTARGKGERSEAWLAYVRTDEREPVVGD